jgi:hypothetical protein
VSSGAGFCARVRCNNMREQTGGKGDLSFIRRPHQQRRTPKKSPYSSDSLLPLQNRREHEKNKWGIRTSGAAVGAARRSKGKLSSSLKECQEWLAHCSVHQTVQHIQKCHRCQSQPHTRTSTLASDAACWPSSNDQAGKSRSRTRNAVESMAGDIDAKSI